MTSELDRRFARFALRCICRVVNRVERHTGLIFVLDDEGWIGFKRPDVSPVAGASNMHMDGSADWKVVG
jgi:hypothetical protein